MQLTAEDFAALGFWEDVTPEEQIVVYGMDFGDDYVLLTDELGRTPAQAQAIIVAAVYDGSDCFLWGREIKDFAALKELCQGREPGSSEIFKRFGRLQITQKIKSRTVSLKKTVLFFYSRANTASTLAVILTAPVSITVAPSALLVMAILRYSGLLPPPLFMLTLSSLPKRRPPAPAKTAACSFAFCTASPASCRCSSSLFLR